MFYGGQIGSQSDAVKGANCLSAGLVWFSREAQSHRERERERRGSVADLPTKTEVLSDTTALKHPVVACCLIRAVCVNVRIPADVLIHVQLEQHCRSCFMGFFHCLTDAG